MLEKSENNIHLIQNKENNEKVPSDKYIFGIDNLFRRYKNIITIKNQIIVEDIPKYLNIIYIILRKEYIIYKEKALSLLWTIISKLNGAHVEFNLLKDNILEKTMIFFVLIKMYVSYEQKKSTNDLLAKILKSLLIGNTEMIQTLSNLLPKSLFEKIQIDPEPFNWINEWDDFLQIMKQNILEAKVIWNEECRNELIKYLEKKCHEFDEVNFPKKIKNELKGGSEKENSLNEINTNINLKESTDEFDKELFLKISKISINYQKFSLNYISLKNEIFVWKYYLKELIKETRGMPTFTTEIENPKKLWKNIIYEICLEEVPEKIVTMLKVLILLYKQYYTAKKKFRKEFKVLGKFSDYQFFLNLYQKHDNMEIKTYIIQLLYVSVTCFEKKAENRKELLLQDDTGSVILSYINLIESQIKDELYSINFDTEEYSNKPVNFFYIDKEKEALKFYKDVESRYVIINNGSFINYSNYCPVDEESWKLSDDKFKLLCIVCSLYHSLKKQLKRNNKENKIDLPLFPIPKITKILYVKNNYNAILKLLLYDNNNLSYHALNLFNYYIIDIFNDNIGNDFCVLDILFILMIKYKSIKILRTIEKISNIYLKKNKKAVYEDLKLTEEEIEFFEHFTNLEKQKNPQIKLRKPVILLIRYFPLQIIYYLMANKFEDFIKLIYTKEDINTYQIIWNRTMLEDLLKSVRGIILKNKDLLIIDKKYRYDYSSINQKYKNFFIYYIKDNYDEVLKNINEGFFVNMINILLIEKYIVDFDYIQLLHIIIEKSISKLTKEIKEKIKSKISSHIYPNNSDDIEYNANINKEVNLDFLKYYLKILSLIDENENDILKYNNNINLTIYKILEGNENLSFDKEDNNAKILLALLNYLLEQPKMIKLLDSIENEKEKDDVENESQKLTEKNKIKKMDNDDNKMMNNMAVNDNISKIVQKISVYADTLFEINKDLFIAFLKYFTYLCIKDENIINYISMTIFPLQLLRLCTRYEPSKNIEKNNIYFVIFRALKTMLKSDQLKEIMEKLLSNKRLMLLFSGNGTNFLTELTQGHMRPKLIWSKKDLESLVKFLDKAIDDFFVKHKYAWVIYSKIKESEKEDLNDELKIGNIYIKIYNADPKPKTIFENNEKENFLSKLINEFLKQENINNLKHILWSICNVIIYQKIDIKFLLNLPYEELLNKFYIYTYHITHLNEEEKTECLKNEEDDIQIYKIKESCPKNEKIAYICLQFIEILSKNDTTIINLKESNMIYSFILLIEFSKYSGSLKIICSILNNLFNYNIEKNKKDFNSSSRTKFISEGNFILYQKKEKRIKSIFLFLFKKLLYYSQNKKNFTEKEEFQYIEIFSIINSYFNSKIMDLNLRELYKYYIPVKMIDNLFHSISPEQRNDKKIIQKIFNDWLKDKIEFPDLKWNTKTFNPSYKLLCDDCQMVLNDKSLIDNFDNIYIETNRITENKVFFENPDEYKIDNIYLRLFNKQPNYNIGHNLPILLLHVIDDMLDHLSDYFIYSYGKNPNSDLNLIEKLKSFKEKCLLTSLTSIMLIIEQININNQNPNLVLSTDKEFNNPISKKENFKKEMLQLVKISFDYQKLLSEDNCKALIQMQKIIYFYENDEKNNNIKIYFNSEIRLIYLQILYLIATNEYRAEYLSENFEDNIILDFYFNLLEQKENNKLVILDYEYILVCSILDELIAVDISHIPIILAQYLDKFWNLSEKRPNIKKYIQILFKSIEMDSQYGNSLIRCKNTYNFIFDEKLKINEALIWRIEYGEKKDIKFHYCNFNDFIEKNNKGEFKDCEFPIILDKSTNYFKFDEFSDDLINKEVKKIKDYELDRKNETFINMKELLDQIENI